MDKNIAPNDRKISVTLRMEEWDFVLAKLGRGTFEVRGPSRDELKGFETNHIATAIESQIGGAR